MFKKILICLAVASFLSLFKLSAQEISSSIEYQINIGSDLSSEITSTHTVFNSSTDKVITDFTLNIPFKNINVIQVLFNNNDIQAEISESDDFTALNVNLGLGAIKPGDNGVFKIIFLHRNLIKETNAIKYIKVDSVKSSHEIASVNFLIDYSKSSLGTPSFISTPTTVKSKKLEINSSQLLIQWNEPSIFNISFIQDITSKTSEDILFNFINEDYYESVSYSDVKEFKYGLKDSRNNRYAVTSLAEGKNTIGYISTVKSIKSPEFRLSGDDLSDLITINQKSSPPYAVERSFQANINSALYEFRDISIKDKTEFKSILEYYSNIQTPIDQCLFLSKLGESWKFDVEIIAGVMTYDYGFLNSNQHIWCKIAHEDKIYSIDPSLTKLSGYSFFIEGDFADRLPVVRFTKNSIDSFFFKYFKNLNISVTQNLNPAMIENIEAEAIVKYENEKNFSGEPVYFSLEINNPTNKFIELSSVEFNDIDINLETKNNFLFTLVPLNQNHIPIQVILEKDFFVNTQKKYVSNIKLSNGQEFVLDGTIALEIDILNLVLNFTLILLTLILFIYILFKYNNYKKRKVHFIKK